MKNLQPSFDSKAEGLNKNLVLSQKCDVTFAKDAMDFIGKICLVTPKDKLEKTISTQSLLIYDLLRIFEVVIWDKRDTTVPEDLVVVLKWLSNQLAFCVFKILMRCESLCVVFKVSTLMNCIFQGMGEKENMTDYQKLILHHSTMVLRYSPLIQKH